MSRSTPLTGTGAERLRIFTAWSDEPWINEGAAVRVSLVCFGPDDRLAVLNGHPVAVIHADLTGQPLGGGDGVDLIGSVALGENALVSFQGSQKIGAFDIPGDLARTWLALPNPNHRSNAEVLKPSWNGLDATRRPRDGWIIDFGNTMSEMEASLFEAPFQYVVEHVKPERIQNPRPIRAKYWWRHGDPQPAMRAALKGLFRYIATPHVSKHRFFVWMDKSILPDKMLIVTARADDTTFGILHSRFHELWSLRMGTSLEDRPRYTPTTTFETFPFPAGLTPTDTKGTALPEPPGIMLPPVAEDRRHLARAIAQAAFDLNQKREAWLNPPEWVDWVITPEEEQAGFPRRPVAKPGHEADLKQRTLTNLYNARPAWLAMAHEALDHAVAAAYGWDDYTPDMPDEEIPRRLLALNHERAATGTKS